MKVEVGTADRNGDTEIRILFSGRVDEIELLIQMLLAIYRKEGTLRRYK